MDALTFSNRVLGFVNAPALMQRIVARLQGVTVDVADYQRKRDFMYEGLRDAGYEVVKPQGAFYIFPRSPVADELRVVDALFDRGVLVVPGRGFGMEGYFRISFCVEQFVLDRAMPALREVAAALRG
jgi:aspartate aminotransferase